MGDSTCTPYTRSGGAPAGRQAIVSTGAPASEASTSRPRSMATEAAVQGFGAPSVSPIGTIEARSRSGSSSSSAIAPRRVVRWCGKLGLAGIEQQHAVAVLEPLVVRVAGDEHVEGGVAVDRTRELARGVDAARDRLHVVDHADPPARVLDVLDGGAAWILEVVVRAKRAAYWRELLAPVQHQRLRDVAAVKDQVHRGELFLERAAQLAGVADRARHVGVGEDGDAHRAMVRAMPLSGALRPSGAAHGGPP